MEVTKPEESSSPEVFRVGALHAVDYPHSYHRNYYCTYQRTVVVSVVDCAPFVPERQIVLREYRRGGSVYARVLPTPPHRISSGHCTVA